MGATTTQLQHNTHTNILIPIGEDTHAKASASPWGLLYSCRHGGVRAVNRLHHHVGRCPQPIDPKPDALGLVWRSPSQQVTF